MLIQLKEVSKVYQRDQNQSIQAVHSISLEIERGDIFGIIGQSGAGKSTLLRLINGLEKPTEGEIRIFDQPLDQLDEKELRQFRQKMGMIFQGFHLLWSRTVRENIAFPLEVAGLSDLHKKKRVDELLARVGLEEHAEAYPSQLSGGQKQRVGIARALANQPEILLCDEATSALDPETTSSILQLLKEIHEEMNLTLVMITHEMSVIENICTRVAVMDRGRIVEVGNVDQVLYHPVHSITRRFVDLQPDEQLVQLPYSKESFDWVETLAKEYLVKMEIQAGEIRLRVPRDIKLPEGVVSFVE